jgi:hypothetical protein
MGFIFSTLKFAGIVDDGFLSSLVAQARVQMRYKRRKKYLF